MSGHSKWSKVKHQKAATDLNRGQAFTKASQAITLAVREGGGIDDPAANFKLRLALDKAKDVNMPKETIQRAIVRAKGSKDGNFNEVVYEAFGPSGVAILIYVFTDNPNRTVSTLKNILERYEGSLGGPGTVAHLFKRQGIVSVAKGKFDADQITGLAIDAGADEVVEKGNNYDFYTEVALLDEVKDYLLGCSVQVLETVVRHVPVLKMKIDLATADKLNKLICELVAIDDVLSVVTNVS